MINTVTPSPQVSAFYNLDSSLRLKDDAFYSKIIPLALGAHSLCCSVLFETNAPSSGFSGNLSIG
jgi:hypothetical protein